MPADGDSDMKDAAVRPGVRWRGAFVRVAGMRGARRARPCRRAGAAGRPDALPEDAAGSCARPRAPRACAAA